MPEATIFLKGDADAIVVVAMDKSHNPRKSFVEMTRFPVGYGV
jgi:hypothetical protein